MVAHPFRTAADTVDANVTEGGVTETLYDALQKRTVFALGPTESLGDFDLSDGSPPLALVASATGYVYFYNADDTTTADDGLTCLVSADGKRYILADASAIAISSVLAIDNDPPVSPSAGDAYVVNTVPTGDWVGHAKDIALYTPRGWVFATPQVGCSLLNEETGLNIQYSAAGSWGSMATALDVAVVTPELMLFPGGLSVEAQQNAPPGSPTAGDGLYYLVGTSGSGAWSGHSNDIAYYNASAAWAFIDAYDGMSVFNKATDSLLTWFSATGAWSPPWPYQSTCQGRLTLESGVAISTTDQTAKATLYFTPFRGNNIALYTTGGWALRSFTEKSLSLSGYTSGKPYDIFGYDNSGVLALESLVWTNDTTRATALTLQDGIYVKSGDATRRYLGTIYTSATGQCEDSLAKRLVFNATDRRPRPMFQRDTTNSWTYATTTIRQANASTSNQLEFVIGLSEDEVEAQVIAAYNGDVADARGYTLIGLDSTTAMATGCLTVSSFAAASAPGGGNSKPAANTAIWRGYPGVGRHTLTWLERGFGTTTVTWLGDDGSATYFQSGISGTVNA